MTKKVLISWEQLEKLAYDFLDVINKEDCVSLRPALAWFEAQPDINDIISDAVKDGLEKAKESFIQAAILKMQTTGGENDN